MYNNENIVDIQLILIRQSDAVCIHEAPSLDYPDFIINGKRCYWHYNHQRSCTLGIWVSCASRGRQSAAWLPVLCKQDAQDPTTDSLGRVLCQSKVTDGDILMDTSDPCLYRVSSQHLSWTEYLNITWQLQLSHLNLYLKCTCTSHRNMFLHPRILYCTPFPVFKKKGSERKWIKCD